MVALSMVKGSHQGGFNRVRNGKRGAGTRAVCLDHADGKRAVPADAPPAASIARRAEAKEPVQAPTVLLVAQRATDTRLSRQAAWSANEGAQSEPAPTRH